MLTATSPRRRDWKRSSFKNPCPICFNKKSECSFTQDFYEPQVVYCHHTPSDTPAPVSSIKKSWKHLTGLVSNSNKMTATVADLRPAPPASATPAPQPLSLEQIDNINRAYLALCPISKKHKNMLEADGIPSEGVGTLFYKDAPKIAKKLVDRFGADVCRQHPVFREVEGKDGRNWWTIASAADGVLFPATNFARQILGVQIRKDEPKGSNDRYRWMSSNGKGGTPLTVFQAALGANSAHSVIITEGYKKAAIASKNWNCHAISLAGVNAYKIDELISTIDALKVTVVTLAFDQDKREKKQVKEAEQLLFRRLVAALPEVEFYFLSWDQALGKGLDDALKAGAEFAFESAKNESTRLARDLSAASITRHFKPKKIYTLNQARREHVAIARYVLTRPDGSQLAITSPTGTGKSSAFDITLADLVQRGQLGGRVVLLCPNKNNIEERTAPGTPLGRAVAAGLAVVQTGRNKIDLNNPNQKRTAFDCANDQASEAGQRRQIPAKIVCKDCVFGSDQNWTDSGYSGKRTFRCEVEGYLASKKASEQAQIVIATKESYLNNSEEINKFDVVICDEDLLNYLIEKIEVTDKVFSSWRDAIAAKNIHAPAWLQLMQVVEKAFNTLAAQPAPGFFEMLDCDVPLRAAASDLKLNYDQIIFDLQSQSVQTGDDFYFEKPYKQNARKVIPFRGAGELLQALNDKHNPARFKRDSLNGSFSLILTMPRLKLINILREKTLVILDATVNPNLKSLFPKLEEVCYNVSQNQHVTQCVSGLYTQRDLQNPRTREKIERAIDAFFVPGQRNLVIMPLRFESGKDALKVSPGTRTGHWGKDERATNAYSDFDAVVLVGHPLRPIDIIKSETCAVRSAVQKLDSTSTGRPDPAARAGEKLRLYNHVQQNGLASGRWMKADSDTDLQAVIEHDHTASVVQAVGRLRAALRPKDQMPARILVLDAEPASDLKIDQLVTIDEIITNPPEKQVFMKNNYMKSDEKGGLVPAYSDVAEGRNLLDPDSSQYETRETQVCDPWDATEPPPPDQE